MTSSLNRNAKGLLKIIVEHGSYGVYADNIPEAAILITTGYATAEDDYEGPRLYPTKKGKKHEA